MTSRTLAFQLGLLAVLLTAANLVVKTVGMNHLVPVQRLHRAVEAGDRCLLILGASRTVAAIDVPELNRAAGEPRPWPCVANLSIGGITLEAQVLAGRTYRQSGRAPSAVVLGFADHELLDTAPPDPDAMVGNMASMFYWSRAADVTLEYPAFPARYRDYGLRFLIRRATTLTALGSVFGAWIQEIQRAWRPEDRAKRNRFGAVADMQALAAQEIRESLERFERAREGSGWRQHRWLAALQADLKREGIPLVFVRLPTTRQTRMAIAQSASATQYRAWLARQGDIEQFSVLDLSNPAWLSDALFADSLHFSEEGARQFSRDLGQALPRLIAPRTR